jgi:hypothetical protein
VTVRAWAAGVAVWLFASGAAWAVECKVQTFEAIQFTTCRVLNRRTGFGNFYQPPNGVFLVDDAGARVITMRIGRSDAAVAARRQSRPDRSRGKSGRVERERSMERNGEQISPRNVQ